MAETQKQSEAPPADQKPSLTPAQKRAELLRGLMEERKDSIQAVIPKHLTAEKLFRLAMIAISRNPGILQCTTTSVIHALTIAGQLGLDPTGVGGQGYIVPYWNTRISKREATFIPGYRGLIHLARNSGSVRNIEAHVVHEKDVFVLERGLHPILRHVPFLGADRGSVVGAYVIAWLTPPAFTASGEVVVTGADVLVEYMLVEEMNKIRDRVFKKTKTQAGPWSTDEDEMYRKTPVRRICKYLPASVELAQAMEQEDALAQGRQPSSPLTIDLPPDEGASALPPEGTEDSDHCENVEPEPPDDGFQAPTPEEERAAMDAEKTRGEKLAGKIKRNGKQADLPMK
jgi:recombination protein RecT